MGGLLGVVGILRVITPPLAVWGWGWKGFCSGAMKRGGGHGGGQSCWRHLDGGEAKHCLVSAECESTPVWSLKWEPANEHLGWSPGAIQGTGGWGHLVCLGANILCDSQTEGS